MESGSREECARFWCIDSLDDKSAEESDTDDDVLSDTKSDLGSEDESDEVLPISVGETIQRLRGVARQFRKRPVLMNELRKATAKKEFNGRTLRVKLDCSTRWYLTFLMIERVVEILSALNNVLSRSGMPVSSDDAMAFERLLSVLGPFKRAILVLCKDEATLLHTDRAFTLLMQDLRLCGIELAHMLLRCLRDEVKKWRTILSTVLEVLENPHYDFALESPLG